jgi:PPM family protein phosphatase
MLVPGPTAAPRSMHWICAALTDRGRRRRRNEDAYLAAPAARLFAVADGMGGHAAGDVASRIAVDVLAAEFAPPPSPRIRHPTLTRRLLRAFAAVNDAILAHAASHPECGGMGTTLTTVAPLVAAPRCVVAHVGDSRLYRLRGGELAQITQDHTWVQQQVDAGMLTPGEARHHPLSSLLNRVLGTPQVGPADTLVIDAAPGDLLLLCSDGMTTMVEDADLCALLDRPLPLDELARQLVEAANLRGGADNITVVLVQAEAS